MPSPVPTPAACSHEFLKCGETIHGTNIGKGDFSGGPSPDANYLIVHYAYETIEITVHTCHDDTSFPTRLSLYDGCPSQGGTLLNETTIPYTGVPFAPTHEHCAPVNLTMHMPR